MNFKLGNVVSYIGKSGLDIEKAAKEFFKNTEINPDMPGFVNISALFNEWLVYDCKLPSGRSVISDYYFKNPDRLSDFLIDELKQIIETYIYDLFEVEKTDPGASVTVWGLFTGKRYQVYEKSMSLQIGSRKGCFFNRIARVNKKHYFIGSDPSFIPLTHTDRSRNMLKSGKKESITPKLALPFLIPAKSKSKPMLNSKEDIKRLREKLRKQFKKLREKYKVFVSFEMITDFLFRENYKDHFADFYKDLTSIGITEKMIVENTKFFQDFWNYFPHKILDGKCPAEKYKEVYG